MLVKITDFRGNLSLSLTASPYAADTVIEAIEQWERVFYTALVGEYTYTELLAAFDSETPPVPSTELVRLHAMTHPLAVRFVYCHYLQDNARIATGLGVAKPENSVSSQVKPLNNQWPRWNEMSDGVRAVIKWLLDGNYPDASFDLPAIKHLKMLNKSNSFGLWT